VHQSNILRFIILLKSTTATSLCSHNHIVLQKNSSILYHDLMQNGNAYLFKIDVRCKFHIFGMYVQNLETTRSVRNANVYLTIKPTFVQNSICNTPVQLLTVA